MLTTRRCCTPIRKARSCWSSCVPAAISCTRPTGTATRRRPLALPAMALRGRHSTGTLNSEVRLPRRPGLPPGSPMDRCHGLASWHLFDGAAERIVAYFRAEERLSCGDAPPWSARPPRSGVIAGQQRGFSTARQCALPTVWQSSSGNGILWHPNARSEGQSEAVHSNAHCRRCPNWPAVRIRPAFQACGLRLSKGRLHLSPCFTTLVISPSVDEERYARALHRRWNRWG